MRNIETTPNNLMTKRTGDRTMELTKQDTQKAKGVAIIGMVMLHLFCRLDDLPYVPWIWIRGTPFVYYLGLFGDKKGYF